MATRKTAIGIIGGRSPSSETVRLAYEVGKHVAMNNAILVSGGLDGTMEAASRGAAENGGTVLGVLPGEHKEEANPHVHIPLPTGMGIGRNTLVVRFSDVLIAFPGAFGTLSEMALALNLGKTVVCFPDSWQLKRIGQIDGSLMKEAFDAAQAVGVALNSIRK